MNVAMVKHGNSEKIYWFEVPAHLSDAIKPGIRVACHTARGRKYGIVVGSVVNKADVHELMVASGATFPLRQIVATTASDEKIAKRFMEYYHNKKFNTNVLVADNGLLLDGYTAYLVAKVLGLPYISGITYHPQPLEYAPF